MLFRKNQKTENVIVRKGYYGFARNYPVKGGSGKFFLGESRAVKKRESMRRALIIILLLVLFAASFIVTEVCLNISEKPVSQAFAVQSAVYNIIN